MVSSSDSSSLGIKIVTFRAQHQFVLDCWVRITNKSGHTNTNTLCDDQ
jgi:hypothetical protein